ncbi:endonuclease/exonuclease/phosphatase family protein [Pseudonocardia phyllosphaerae]|uniref:endonuclease/exonuclease/phosphatase family protein n=1 Tax=Pseudonocardia phyllosphaerae TaxID=3390502 RepID=UPI00397849B9
MSSIPRRAVLPGLLGAGAAAALLPDLLRVDHRFPLVDVTAWRPHASVAALAGAVALAPFRAARPSAVALGMAGAAGAAATFGVRRAGAVAGTAGRSLGDRHGPEADADGPEITILGANVLLGRADTGALAALVAAEQPDLVVLPEAGVDFRDKILPLLDGLGYRGWSSIRPGARDGGGVVLLASPRAGDVQVHAERGMRIPHLVATGGILGRRSLYAVHTTAPMGRARARAWARDLRLIAGWTRSRCAPIVVGDLNATLDHRLMREALGGCTGVVTRADATYPASLPRWAGIRIDHVLVPRGAVTRHYAVHDVPETDHRAVCATVVLPGQEP